MIEFRMRKPRVELDCVPGLLSAVSLLVFIFFLGAAVGTYGTARWIADEIQAHFECVGKSK
jgi:hypothetical protein